MSADDTAGADDSVSGHQHRNGARSEALDAIVIDQAETAVSQARISELQAAVVAANQRLTAAVDLLLRAERGGTAEQSEAARQAVHAAREEFARVAEPAVLEMQQIAEARMDGAAEVLALIQRAQPTDSPDPDRGPESDS